MSPMNRMGKTIAPALCWLWLAGPAASAEEISVAGSYDLQGAQQVKETGALRPLAGRLTIEQSGSELRTSLHLRGMTRREQGMLRVEYLAKGTGEIDGREIRGRIETQVTVPTPGRPSERTVIGVIPNEFTGTVEPDGSLRFVLDYEPVAGGGPDALHVETRARRIDSARAEAPPPPPDYLRFVTRVENDAAKLGALAERAVGVYMMVGRSVPGLGPRDLGETIGDFDVVLARIDRIGRRAAGEDSATFAVRLSDVRGAWTPVRDRLLSLQKEPVQVAEREILELEAQGRKLLEASEALAHLFEEHCDPTLHTVCHVSVSRSGRQRIITERMTREILFLLAGIGPVSERRERLQADLTEFAAQQATIREGLEVGSDPRVLESAPELERVDEYWDRFREHVRRALAGKEQETNVPDLLLQQAQLESALDQFTTQVAFVLSEDAP